MSRRRLDDPVLTIIDTLCLLRDDLTAARHRALDTLLGPHCPHDCGQRIYPKDAATHNHHDHAGDDLP